MSNRNLKDALRHTLDVTLSDLAYNIGFQLKDADMGTHTVSWHVTKKYGPIHKHIHKEKQEPVKNHFSGKLSDYNSRWIHTAGKWEEETAYIYEPKNRPGCKIIFYDLKMNDIDDIEYKPAEEAPQGKPKMRTYEIGNNAPRKKTEEFEIEDESTKENERTFGWLVGTEFEASTRVTGGVGVSAEFTASLKTRVEAHGDSRFTSRTSHRELLRGPRIVGPYAKMIGVIEERMVKLTQPVIVTGKLDASVYIEAEHPHARSTFTSIAALYDCMRGFGGTDGRVAEWWGKPGKAIKENKMQKTFEPLLPVIKLELRPHDTVTLMSKKDVHEEPYPGREDLYEQYKDKPKGGDDFDL